MENDIINVEAEDFPSQFKQIRLNKALTQTELAEKAKVSQQTVSAIEKGKLDPSLKLLLALAGVLGVSLLINAFTKKGGDAK